MKHISLKRAKYQEFIYFYLFLFYFTKKYNLEDEYFIILLFALFSFHSNWLQKFAKWPNSSSTMTELFPTSKHCQTLICCRQELKSNLSGLLLQKGGAEAFCPQSASLSLIVFEVLEKLNLFLQALPKPLSVPLLQTQRLAKNFLPLIISQWQAYTLCVWARVWVHARVCA